MRPATSSNPGRLVFATFGFACLCGDRNVVNAFALPRLRQYSLSSDPLHVDPLLVVFTSSLLRKRKRGCASSTIQPLFSTTKPIEIHESARSVAAMALQKSKKGMGAAQKLESLPAFIHLADQRDRSFARALVATVERREGQIDKVLALCADSTYPPKKGKHAALVQACLRLGAAQLLFLDSPPHAAIKETVDILKMRRPGQKLPPESMVKFANAVLRRIQREGKDMLKSQTSSRDNIEEWLVKEWEECWGVENANIIADQSMVEPHIDLSVKIPAHMSSADALFVLEEMSEQFGDEAAVLPNGSIRVGLKGAVSSWPQYDEGKWWVQSAASTLPATGLLNALREGDSNIEDIHVVDMCAAPGGKTAQLLSAGFGIVTAIEANARRSRRLFENLERLQLSDRCDIVVTEGQEWQPGSNHDDDDSNIAGILLDVPCSATGTGVRRPDVLRRDSDLGNLPEVQEALLNHCADNILKVGGVLVFSTCSLLKRESEDQVQQLLTRTAGKMVTLPFKKGEIGGFDGAIDENGWLRVLPGVLNEPLNSVDGFFVARLQKVA